MIYSRRRDGRDPVREGPSRVAGGRGQGHPVGGGVPSRRVPPGGDLAAPGRPAPMFPARPRLSRGWKSPWSDGGGADPFGCAAQTPNPSAARKASGRRAFAAREPLRGRWPPRTAGRYVKRGSEKARPSRALTSDPAKGPGREPSDRSTPGGGSKSAKPSSVGRPYVTTTIDLDRRWCDRPR